MVGSDVLGDVDDGGDPSSACRMEVVFTGRVQGVFFRATTQRIAGGFPITGWVRNEPDGRVRVVAEGPRAALVAFHEAILAERCGDVTGSEASFGPARGDLDGFRIVR
jgi:acylphosphatase